MEESIQYSLDDENVTIIRILGIFSHQHRIIQGFLQKYPVFGFVFNFISTFKIINKNIFF